MNNELKHCPTKLRKEKKTGNQFREAMCGGGGGSLSSFSSEKRCAAAVAALANQPAKVALCWCHIGAVQVCCGAMLARCECAAWRGASVLRWHRTSGTDLAVTADVFCFFGGFDGDGSPRQTADARSNNHIHRARGWLSAWQWRRLSCAGP